MSGFPWNVYYVHTHKKKTQQAQQCSIYIARTADEYSFSFFEKSIQNVLYYY